jgi:hypothetical protein
MRLLSLLLSSELIGDERHSAEVQIALVRRLLDASHAPADMLAPAATH